MIAELGIITLGLAFVMALIAVVTALVGEISKQPGWLVGARNALVITLPLLTLSCLILIWAQWTGEYSIVYVSSVSANTQPDLLKITALWGGQAGSLMFYGWMLSAFSVLAVAFAWRSQRRLMGWVVVVMSATLAFFLAISFVFENPFERFWMSPSGQDFTREVALLAPEGKVEAYPWLATTSAGETYTDYNTSSTVAPDFGGAPFLQSIAEYDGQGLNPLLRHWGMVIHPPFLYLGFTGFIVPFAFAIASLIKGEMEPSWIRVVRRWTLVAWACLSVGLILGGRWAYDVLGWGGYWGWDPVENSAFLPWLTGTAFLHSVMIQEKRGMLKAWNMIMIITTYLLVVFGTMATRTGLLSSVHSFAESPLSVPMMSFLAVTAILSIGLYVWRDGQGFFQGDHEIESLLSRESIFLLNNLVFLTVTAFVFWGTWAEKITDFMVGLGLRESVINYGRPYYEGRIPVIENIPLIGALSPIGILFGIIFVLMGVAPLVAWRRATAKRVGRALMIPTVLSLLGPLFIMVVYDADVGAMIGMALLTFALSATLLEIHKGAMARQRAHGEFYPAAAFNLMMRNRRRYGGYIIHLGVVIMGIGIIGSTIFQEVRNVTLDPGQTASIHEYTIRYEDGFVATADDTRQMVMANVSLLNEDGEQLATLRPRRDIFRTGSPMSISGSYSTLEEDFYVLLTFFEGDRISFRVYYNPLISFVWFGGLMMVFGTIMAVWTNEEKASRVRVRSPRQRPMTAAASAGD
jgi:cytochrome c-type biogenesis protein CcmF